MLLLLLTLTLGVMVADAGKLLYEVQQQQQMPSEDGLLCPDQASMCSNAATCCMLSSGKWGCCPFTGATCCEDNVHCCPNGYSCHKTKDQCVRAINNDTMPWAKKEEASAVSESSSSEEAMGPSNGLICPDRSYCPGTASCCGTPTEAYRCCTYPNDVCCSNGYSCCPRSTICDQLNNKCMQGFETEIWKKVSPSIPASLPSETIEAAGSLKTNIVVASGDEKMSLSPLKATWCNGPHDCSGLPCCWRPALQAGQCCSLSGGTCCLFGRVCCPPGTRCNVLNPSACI